MSDAPRRWIAPVGLLCLSMPIFGATTLLHAGEIFAFFLLFVMICVWVDSRTQWPQCDRRRAGKEAPTCFRVRFTASADGGKFGEISGPQASPSDRALSR